MLRNLQAVEALPDSARSASIYLDNLSAEAQRIHEAGSSDAETTSEGVHADRDVQLDAPSPPATSPDASDNEAGAATARDQSQPALKGVHTGPEPAQGDQPATQASLESEMRRVGT